MVVRDTGYDSTAAGLERVRSRRLGRQLLSKLGTWDKGWSGLQRHVGFCWLYISAERRYILLLSDLQVGDYPWREIMRLVSAPVSRVQSTSAPSPSEESSG